MIDKKALEERLTQLQQARQEALSQVHAIDGAIFELENYWLPLIDNAERTKGQSALEPIKAEV